ncbi:MAG TPA: hypothetical protein PKI01_00730 [Bacteroidales bacterium]|nr:hypothetical protein [Bacteroidales bacterium]
MKKIFCLIVSFGLLLNLQAQTQIFSGFNSTHSGRSITLVVSKTFANRHEFGGGLRFNINKLAHPDDQNNVYLKRLYATKPLHYFGIETFYHFYFFKKWAHVKPFVFYDLQATYSTTRNRMFLPYTYTTNGIVLYKEYIELFGPFTWVEQNIGLGFKVDLFNNFFLHEKIGLGTAFILGYDDMLLNKTFNWFAWEFSPLLNVGIGYRFEKKNKK